MPGNWFTSSPKNQERSSRGCRVSYAPFGFFVSFNEAFIPASIITINYAFWESLYWKVRYLYDDQEGIRYLREFGRPFERCVQEITQQSCKIQNEGLNFRMNFYITFAGNKFYPQMHMYERFSDFELRGVGENKLICDKIRCHHNLNFEDY